MVNLNVDTVASQPSTPIRLPYRGYRVARVSTPEETAAVARRRYLVFVERMRALPENSEQLEFDAFDEKAEHFYVSLDGVIVGSMRVVPHTSGGFPMEADGAVLLDSLPRATCAEGSRVNADPVDGYDVAADLIAHAVAWAAGHGITHLVAVSNSRSLRSLQRQGWPVVTFGEPIDHAGTPYFPNYTPISRAVRAAA